MVRLAGGEFLMGADDREGFPDDGEGPVRSVRLSPYFVDETAVTNDAFAAFVRATGYVTDAERFGWSFVFWMLLPRDFEETRAVARAPWWRRVDGACWRNPEGPKSELDGRGAHPVVHVSHDDARAYCAWAGKRLPTEAEWEHAARGGLVQQRFPWGDELTPGGVHRCNVWQGEFPTTNTAEDGFVGTAPVRSYPPNGFGLYEMVGNVWEWCADFFDPVFDRRRTRVDPKGPDRGTTRVIRGGSYLCHASYCNRYRVAARSSNEPAASTGHMGFRCVADAG
jgi:formylglycine-generating enzyme required for sulfatase activity